MNYPNRNRSVRGCQVPGYEAGIFISSHEEGAVPGDHAAHYVGVGVGNFVHGHRWQRTWTFPGDKYFSNMTKIL